MVLRAAYSSLIVHVFVWGASCGGIGQFKAVSQTLSEHDELRYDGGFLYVFNFVSFSAMCEW